MYILQIEHPVPNFEGWKKAFDSDPINRKASGVRSYKISRKADEPNYIIIDLDFDNMKEAEACHGKLRNLWARVEGSVMNDPRSRIIEVIENENL
jgi:ribosomal protein L35AE/L33A